jgi:serine/threonine protein kinase
LGHPYLIDFGISSFYSVDNNDQSGGSLGYMPPEIIALHNHNYTVDYFALGIIVF